MKGPRSALALVPAPVFAFTFTVTLALAPTSGCSFDVELAARRADGATAADATAGLDGALDATNATDATDATDATESADGPDGTDDSDRAETPSADAAPIARTLLVSLHATTEERGSGGPRERTYETRATFEFSPDEGLAPALTLTLVGAGGSSAARREGTRFVADLERYAARWTLELRAPDAPPREVAFEGPVAHTLELPPPRRPAAGERLVVRWSPAGADGAGVSVGSQSEQLVADTGSYVVPPEALRGGSGELHDVTVRVRRWTARRVRSEDGALWTASRVEVIDTATLSFE